MAVLDSPSFRGVVYGRATRDLGDEPGIQKSECVGWIPGSLAKGSRPGMTKE
jgi:hypothetical protein